MRVSYNLEILPAEKSFVSAVSSAALYGKGVFTTLAIFNGKPFLWGKHWLRLRENSAQLGIDLSGFAEDAVKGALARVIAQNQLETARARLTFFEESSSRIWSFSSERKTGVLITAAGLRDMKDDRSAAISPFSINSQSPLAGVKSCNYLENLLAFEKAREEGFDEAIRLNEHGEVAAASMANVFWVKGGKIFTPPLDAGCLAGTTRELLLENFPAEEKRAGLKEFLAADEIFLTSSGIGIKSVKNVGDKSFGTEFTDELKSFYAERTRLV